MNDDFKDKYVVELETLINKLKNKLKVCKVGLKAIILEGSDNLHIAEKTLIEIEKITDNPQD